MTAAWSFDAIGTRWQIDSPAPLPDSLRGAVTSTVEEYDRTFSRFRADSLVHQHARRGGTLTYPPAAGPLLTAYEQVRQVTGGRVTPLVSVCLEALGYGPDYRLVPMGAPEPAPAVGLTVADTRVTLSEPVLLDVGAAGKGQLVDLTADLLIDAGVRGATIDASGDLRHDGDGLLVALEHPLDATSAIGVVQLGGTRRAIAGSAVNRRAWGDGWHHVLDALTGHPVRDVIATWAITADAMHADLLATALFFTPGEELERDFDLDWVRVLADGRLESSADLPGEVFA